jgi:hypothetical protein
MAATVDVFYETDGNKKMRARVSAATDTANPNAPAGPADAPGLATIGRSRKSAGVHMRYLNLKRTVGTAPNQAIRRAKVAMLSEQDYAAATDGSAFTYNGQSWTISSHTPEKVV